MLFKPSASPVAYTTNRFVFQHNDSGQVLAKRTVSSTNPVYPGVGPGVSSGVGPGVDPGVDPGVGTGVGAGVGPWVTSWYALFCYHLVLVKQGEPVSCLSY